MHNLIIRINSMKKSTLIHLRIPFSFFLLPVFLFGVAIAQSTDWMRISLVFFILHFLLYPASNGYNSYFDKDEKSIGGVERPPKVSKNLYLWSLIFDGCAITLGLLISWPFSTMLLVYGLVSKAYSHPLIRFKKRPIIGWLVVGVFQGYFTFLMTGIGISDLSLQSLFSWYWQAPAILSTLMLLGSYPMTQVYQHEEDIKRGDRTISSILGVIGTFYFTGIFFTLSSICYFIYFMETFSLQDGLLFIALLAPVVFYFFRWMYFVKKDSSNADYRHTMRLNFISALMLNLFFLIFAVNL